jgi:hypothetical protein
MMDVFIDFCVYYRLCFHAICVSGREKAVHSVLVLLVVWFIGVHAYGWDHVFIFLMALRRRYHCVIIGLQFLSVSQVTAFGWVAKVDVAGSHGARRRLFVTLFMYVFGIREDGNRTGGTHTPLLINHVYSLLLLLPTTPTSPISFVVNQLPLALTRTHLSLIIHIPLDTKS